MTGFDESRHSRDGDGKFSPHASAEQEGELARDTSGFEDVSDEDWEEALRDLHRAGVTSDPSNLPEWRSETGHWFTLALPEDVQDRDDWAVIIKHPGDPAGHWIRVGLGPGHARIGQRVFQALSRPDVARERQKQLQRAIQAGDPMGLTARGGPGGFSEDRTEFRCPRPDMNEAHTAGLEGEAPGGHGKTTEAGEDSQW